MGVVFQNEKRNIIQASVVNGKFRVKIGIWVWGVKNDKKYKDEKISG